MVQRASDGWGHFLRVLAYCTFDWSDFGTGVGLPSTANLINCLISTGLVAWTVQ